MGVDIIRLGGERHEIEPPVHSDDLAKPTFQTHLVNQPPMTIWLMTMKSQQLIFPWWRYESTLDDDLHALNQSYHITTAQHLFDCLILSQIQKFSGTDFYVIFPGMVRKEGWGRLREIDKDTFNRGQACHYHLNANYDQRLTVNWVPYWEPQSLVKNPSFGSLWRLFEGNNGDGVSRCLTFFGLSDPRLLPKVINLLIEKDDHRSEKLAEFIDWYGVYSSPIDVRAGTCAMIYSQSPVVLSRLEVMQDQISALLQQGQNDLISDPRPRTAIRIMSRQIAL